MIRSKVIALTVVGLLSANSLIAFAQSSGGGPPVDKGGMPPYTEMNAERSGPENVLPPGSIGGGNGGMRMGVIQIRGRGVGL
ncbi:hypothetical protein D3C84_691450 [compost metagenome]|jgi:hypothetical protein